MLTLAAIAIAPMVAVAAGAPEPADLPKPYRQPDPLQRLRDRSAKERWEAERRRMLSIHSPYRQEASHSDASQNNQTDPSARPATPIRRIPETVPRGVLSQTVSGQQRRSLGQQYGDLYRETPITDILPFHDYEPQRIRTAEPDCVMVCPCPDGTDCRKPGGTKSCLCPEDYIARPWLVPEYQERQFAQALFLWEASNLLYNPLYFEDPALERYGHSYHDLLQPFASVGRFAGQLVLLPYQMSIDHIRRPVSPLGYYRPGEWAPKLHYQIPLNAKAAAVEGGVVTGLFFLFP